MSTPLPYRGRLQSNQLSSTPARGSPLGKSPSTPYDVYRLQHRQQRLPSSLSPAVNASTQSPNSSGSVFIDQSSPHSFASYRRNAGFGSPGISAARSSPRVSQAAQTSTQNTQNSNTSTRKQTPQNSQSSRFVRRKPWKERVGELPAMWYDQIMFSDYLDFNNPHLGYPLGALLHILSMAVQVMHPFGALHVRKGGSSRGRGSTLFAEEGTLAMRRRNQQDAAWRWSANAIMLFIFVAALSNAYRLFVARRRYHLWLKPTEEALQSENAKLVDLPNDLGPSHTKSWLETATDSAVQALRSAFNAIAWLAKRLLYRIRLIRYVGSVVRFFFPPSSGRGTGPRRPSNVGPQMHALDVWQAPEVPLRIFTVYSPLHALLYVYNIRKPAAGLNSSTRLYALLTCVALMSVVSAQTAAIVYLYTALVKDKTLLAGEVMNEYNQKFVMPRAMPVCRDASTMTTQAEMLTSEDLQGGVRYADAQMTTDAGAARENASARVNMNTNANTGASSTSTPRRPKKGRATAA